jgi:integrase
MRRGELLALRWDDINLKQGVLYVRHTVNKIAGFGYVENDPKMKASRRRVMLPDAVIEALNKQHVKQNQAKQQAGTK